jgi:hypothetical protein
VMVAVASTHGPSCAAPLGRVVVTGLDAPAPAEPPAR